MVVRAKRIQPLCIVSKRSLRLCQMTSGRRLPGGKEAAARCAGSSLQFACDFAMGTTARTLADRRVYTGAEGWLIGEKPLPGEEGECKYYFSTLPATMRLEQLVPFVRGRWPIEQFYAEARAANVAWMTIKDDAGMAYIVILPWSCWPTASLCMNGCGLPKTLQHHQMLANRNALLFPLFIETSCSGSSRTWYSGGLPRIM
jgi:hypothetical protein